MDRDWRSCPDTWTSDCVSPGAETYPMDMPRTSSSAARRYEYMRLRLGTDKVDEGVMFFVYLITFGRPKFILETIDLLLNEEHVSMDETTKEWKLNKPHQEIAVARRMRPLVRCWRDSMEGVLVRR